MPSFDQQVIFLYVKDLEKSACFYGETLALQLVLDQGLARIYRIGLGTAFLEICLSSAVQQAATGSSAARRHRNVRNR